MKKLEILKKEINYIKDSSRRKDLKILIGLLPDYFFEVPAASTGKYHPDFAQGEGGLVRHTKVAVRIAQELLANNTVGAKFSDKDKDLIIMALILHDGVKSGMEHSKYTKFDHPLLASKLIMENKGKVSGILPPNPNEFTKLVKDYVLLDENDYKNYIGASTRIFSPSFTVLLIDNNDLLCYNLSKLDKDSYRELMKKTVTLSADCISFEPESGFTKLYFGENKLKNILIMELQNNEYFVKSKKIKGYRYSKELGLEYIK